MSEKIVVELEGQEQNKEAKAEATVQSFEPSKIGALFFTEKGLTIFPKGYMEKFSIGQKEGLIGTQSQYDYSQIAGTLERVVTLEKENSDLKAKIAKLEAVKVDEKKEEEKVVDKAEVKKMTPEEEEKKRLEEEKKMKDEAAKCEDKETAKAKSVQTEEKDTKTLAEHSNVDDDLRRLMGGLKNARTAGEL
jgi:hypothetical protein